MGFWIPELLLGFYSPVPVEWVARHIFFYEAICIVSAIHWYCTTMRADLTLTHRLHLTIFSNNMNTVDIFNSLHALPEYNPLLKYAIDFLLSLNVDICIVYIITEQNAIADALSCRDFSRALLLAPGLHIDLFFNPS
ncbi:hypothetical protein GYMLUDRAFT_182628 [Collybiopsis luxurians FD-317 M1]|uniref:RNase H type-1 domain-containing protein n=1 Tax=Collybiopsis luxurians FD-317 M1 TaxID=944289 RepID=A0A0D0C749_9AGAR|nr:hypothetical protein GYMLUDRAFT_182628 [Collybiopsis luxurians FD-317 M1]